ncbi:hypothetical protein NHJ13734_002112 [Beauveria thailandica]
MSRILFLLSHLAKLRTFLSNSLAHPGGQFYQCKAIWNGVDADEKKRKRLTLIIGNVFDCRCAGELSYHYFMATAFGPRLELYHVQY